jgi:hypothetical protein
MRTRISRLLWALILSSALLAAPVQAALDSVSGLPEPANDEVPAGGDPAQVAVSLAHGFPIWYQDENGLKLELCTAGAVQLAVGGPFIFPCVEAPPIAGAPVSFPSNFGVEAFYWAAIVADTFVSSDGLAHDALLVLGQDAAFVNDIPSDGGQVVGATIRVRVDTPVAGTYRVTHPFGTRDYVVPAVIAGERGIDQTQDVGGLVAGDFLTALLDGLPPVVPVPFDPSVNVGIVNGNGESVGPFLESAGGAARITDINGNVYLSNPGTELAPLLVPIAPGPFGAVFSIELLDPPPGFQLNAANGSNLVTFNLFQVAGKVFNDGNNQPPVAVPDLAGTTPGGGQAVIDVAANDMDVVGNGNVHGLGLNPQAIAIVDPTSPTGFSRLGPVATVGGGSVRRVTVLASGRSRFVYTPPADPAPGFVDSFQYVIQDTGGLISEPATVSLAVEDLAVNQAVFQPRIGKWRASGTTTHAIGNSVTLFGGPRAALAAAAGGTPEATGSVALRVTGPTSLEFQVQIEPLPATAVTSIRIHTGLPGGGGGAIFTLFNNLIGPFAGTFSGTLNEFSLTPRPTQGVGSFADAINAINSGNAHVFVTAGTPADDLSGPFVRPQIGTAPVQADGTWSFRGKSRFAPGGLLPSVTATSANGVSTFSVPLQVR